MIGDKYQVFYHLDGETVPHGSPVDSWRVAKETRANVFHQNKRVRAVWVMRSNPSLNLQPELRGYTLRRTRHEVA